MAEKFSEVEVEINELALSLLGWEVQDFRARVTTEQFMSGGSFSHKLAISGVFRFNGDDWTDCFSYSREYPVRPAMLLSSPKLSAWPAITELSLGQPKEGRPARLSRNEYFVHTYGAIDHSDLRIEITGYDSIVAGSQIGYIPLGVKELPLEVEDETTLSSIKLTFDQLAAFTHRDDDNSGGDERYGQVRASGRVTFGSAEEILADWVSTRRGENRTAPTVLSEAPFTRPAPNLVFDILDDTGFLLEEISGRIYIRIPVDANGHTPSRAPRWLVDCSFYPGNYSAPPSRVIARVGDE